MSKCKICGTDVKKPISIEARSIVSGRNLEPYVSLFLIYDDKSEDQVCQWTPREAEGHARNVLACIEAANTDSFMVAFLVEKIGVPVENTGGVLQDFRKWRERRQTPERAM